MTTKIICRAMECIFWENKLCTSDEIVYDPEEGCLTYESLADSIDLDDDDDLLDDDDDNTLLEDDDDWDDNDLLLDDDLDSSEWL